MTAKRWMLAGVATVLALGSVTAGGRAAPAPGEAFARSEPNDEATERGREDSATAGPNAKADETRGECSATVQPTGQASKGRGGLRIQTLCTHCNSANIQVGGLSRGLVPIYRDGFPVLGGLATSMLLTDLSADSIANAGVVRGPSSASLSGADAGGSIALTGATAADVPWLQLSGQVGSFDLARGTARVAGALAPNAAGWLALGHTSADVVDDDHDGWADVPAVDRSFAEGNLQLEPGHGQRVLLGVSWIDESNPEGRGAYDPFRALSTGEDSWTREDQAFERREVRLGWDRNDRRGGLLELRALVADRQQSVRSQLTAEEGLLSIGTDLIERLRIGEDDLWSSVGYGRPLGLEWRVRGGLTGSRQEVDAANREPLNIAGSEPPEPELAFESVDLVSGWVEAGWSPSAAWDVTLGLRHDAARLSTRLENVGADAASERIDRTFDATSPRINARFFPSRGWTLRAVVGRTFRPPRPILSQVCCGQRYQTTENVVPETGVTAGFEAAWVPSPRLAASVYVARTEFDDHVLRVVGWSQFFIQTWALANVPESRADRAELALRWQALPRLQLEGSLGWLSFRNTGSRYVDVMVAPPSTSTVRTVSIAIDRIPYEPRRAGTFAATLRASSDVTLFATAAYTGPMSIQQFTRLPQNSELDTETMRATPGFWLVNLSAEIRVNRNLFVSATLNNLTDRLQTDLGDPTTDYNWGPLSGRAWSVGLKAVVDRATRPLPGSGS